VPGSGGAGGGEQPGAVREGGAARGAGSVISVQFSVRRRGNS
jgi:hypothetical protein